MTDPYAETDEWPTTPATRPHGKDHPMNHPENQQQIAQRRSRNATYAEAIRKNLAIPEEIGRWANVLAEVVTPVADQETADLRAEVERWRKDWQGALDDARRYKSALDALVADLRAVLDKHTPAASPVDDKAGER